MTLLELLQLLKKNLALVIALPVICAVACAGVCWGLMTNDYTSSVSLYVLNKSTNSVQGQTVTNSDMAASQSMANDIAVLAKTNRVRTAAARSLGADNLAGYSIGVKGDTNNRVITLTVTGKDPQGAASVADAMAKQVSNVAVEVMDLQAVNIVDSANVPTSPSGPKRTMYTLVAFLAGLFAAVAIVVLKDMLDMTIKSTDEIEDLLGLPVLGRMPYVKKM